MKTLFCILFILIGSLLMQLHSQDLIVKKDSLRIYCKILKIDEKIILYTPASETTSIELDLRLVDKYVLNWLSTKAIEMIPEQLQEPNKKMVAEPIEKQDSTYQTMEFCFSAGTSIPLSDLSNKNEVSATAGFAQIGYVLRFNASRKLYKLMGLNAGLQFQSNPFDVSSYSAYYNLKNANAKHSSVAESWQISTIQGGAVFYLPIDKDINIDLLLNASYSNVRMPQVTINVTEPLKTYTVIRPAASNNAIGLLLGFNCNYKLSKKFSASLMFSYLNTKVSLGNLSTYASNGYYTKYNYDLKIASVYLQMGIKYVLD